MRCWQCQKDVANQPEGHNFCNRCGAPQEEMLRDYKIEAVRYVTVRNKRGTFKAASVGGELVYCKQV